MVVLTVYWTAENWVVPKVSCRADMLVDDLVAMLGDLMVALTVVQWVVSKGDSMVGLWAALKVRH